MRPPPDMRTASAFQEMGIFFFFKDIWVLFKNGCIDTDTESGRVCVCFNLSSCRPHEHMCFCLKNNHF